MALSLLLFWGCDMGPRLETRTFRLAYLRSYEASELIDPYVYGARERHPGAVSVIEGAITVRETRDNLEQIARVLAEFDQPRPDIRLHFQLIEADPKQHKDHHRGPYPCQPFIWKPIFKVQK